MSEITPPPVGGRVESRELDQEVRASFGRMNADLAETLIEMLAAVPSVVVGLA